MLNYNQLNDRYYKASVLLIYGIEISIYIILLSVWDFFLNKMVLFKALLEEAPLQVFHKNHFKCFEK